MTALTFGLKSSAEPDQQNSGPTGYLSQHLHKPATLSRNGDAVICGLSPWRTQLEEQRPTFHDSREVFERRYQQARLTRNPALWVALIVVLAGAAGIYFWWGKSEPAPRLQPLPETAEVSPPIQTAIPQPEISHPIPQESEPPPGVVVKALPRLDESDATIQEALAVPLGEQTFVDIFISKDIARRIVATVDNLPRRKVAGRLFPVKLAAGQLVTSGQGQELTLSPANYARYTPYVRLVERVDTKKLIAVYVHFYPLFQQAYEELGYPKKYFNDRLVEMIDDLLSAPDVQAPVKLVRPKVYYEFADAELEELPAGQKVLVRIGPGNAALVKAKLRDIRREVVAETSASHNN